MDEVNNNSNNILSKVPQITVMFWIAKILTTGMGEVFSDFICKSIDPIIAVLIGFFGLIVSLFIQFKVKKYIPWVYWLTVVMVSIFGTMFADFLHVVLGIPYLITTIFYIILLTVIFVVWHKSENTLSIHSICTKKRELFYWSTVLVTFALGTATGDLTAGSMNLGYLLSAIIFAIIILIPLIGYKIFKLNEVFTFWFAYIITRPLGASVADWMSVGTSRGGLGFGTGIISGILTILIIFIVVYFTIKNKKRFKNI